MELLNLAGAVAVSEEEEAASDDEAALLFAEESVGVEAVVWAVDAEQAGPSDKEEGEEEEEEEGTAQVEDQQDRDLGDPLAEDEAPAARPPPGRRRCGGHHTLRVFWTHSYADLRCVSAILMLS